MLEYTMHQILNLIHGHEGPEVYISQQAPLQSFSSSDFREHKTSKILIID